MKTLQNTYVDLSPETEEPEPKLGPLGFTVYRDGKLDYGHEFRKYAGFAIKRAAEAFVETVIVIAKGLEQMDQDYRAWEKRQDAVRHEKWIARKSLTKGRR